MYTQTSAISSKDKTEEGGGATTHNHYRGWTEDNTDVTELQEDTELVIS